MIAKGAAAQLNRILQLIPALADGQEHRIEDIAQTVGSSRPQMMADLASISDRFDVPGGFVDAISILVEQHVVSVHTSHFHRPMRLTMSELCALELGLTMLRSERTPLEVQAVDRALQRLRETISNVPSNDRHVGTRYAELATVSSIEHLAVIRRAVCDRFRLRLRYRSGSATRPVERIVSPQCLVFAEQMWYMVASGDDETYRFFRLDRVEKVELLDDTFEADASVVARVMASGRPFASESTRTMTVRYSPRIARWVAEREGAKLAADGSVTLEHVVADDAWAVRHVLQYGPEAEILAPEELRAKLVEQLKVLGG